MKIFRFLVFFLALVSSSLSAQDFLDSLGERLSISLFQDTVRARLSGKLDLEYYYFQKPAPALIDASGNDLFNPRLTFFCDAQLGPKFYFFSQVRLDRTFDPSDRGPQIRLDEYALRYTLWDDGRLSVQVGKFATLVGKWVERHLSWDNPFVGAPLVYENPIALEDRSAPGGSFDGRLRDEKDEYIPVIWGPSYASGASVAGRVSKFEYAAEIKNSALASRPESWDATRIGFDHPTLSARLGFRPDQRWNFGLSASEGAYFRPEAEGTLPPGRSLGDYYQILIAQDVSFAWHYLQIWAEFHETRFEVPRLGDADTFGYFLEAKYKITPQLFGALRWNQQFFDEVSDGAGGRVAWSQDISRLDLALGYRFTPHTQLKVQYNVQHEADKARQISHSCAAQLTVRF